MLKGNMTSGDAVTILKKELNTDMYEPISRDAVRAIEYMIEQIGKCDAILNVVGDWVFEGATENTKAYYFDRIAELLTDKGEQKNA